MASASSDDLALVSTEALYGSREATELSATASPDVGTGFVSVSDLYERGDGLDPAQTTRHAGSATLSWLPRRGSTLTVTLRYLGQQYEDDLNIDSLPDALTADGFVQLGLERGVALTGRVEKLFHTLIYTWRLTRPTLS